MVRVDVEADTVLLSVGQMADLSFLGDVSRLQVDPETCATPTPGVFAAGDVAYGARLMIDAIASGKKAARGVYRFLTGRMRENLVSGRFADPLFVMRLMDRFAELYFHAAAGFAAGDRDRCAALPRRVAGPAG